MPIPREDLDLVTSAMVALNMDQALVDQIAKLLESNSSDLGRQQVTRVGAEWFGSAPNAQRIGVNTEMAHQAVEEEFEKLADSLRQYKDALRTWSEEVLVIDADTNADMTTRAQAVEEVNAKLEDARREASDRDMGDGTYEEPSPTAPAHEQPTSPDEPPAAPSSAPSTESVSR